MRRADASEWGSEPWVVLEGMVEFDGVGGHGRDTTAMKFMDSGDPENVLDELLNDSNPIHGLDNLYFRILNRITAFDRRRESTLHQLQRVLGYLVTAAAPMSIETIAYLDTDIPDKWTVRCRGIRGDILKHLRAFLLVPESDNLPITFLHTSIVDFFTDNTRCEDRRFYVNRARHNTRTMALCFDRMHRDLKENICSLSDPSSLNSDVQDAVARSISAGLHYTCCHWADHLRMLGVNVESHRSEVHEAVGRLNTFTEKNLLHWLEVLGLTGELGVAIPAARRASAWLQVGSERVFSTLFSGVTEGRTC